MINLNSIRMGENLVLNYNSSSSSLALRRREAAAGSEQRSQTKLDIS